MKKHNNYLFEIIIVPIIIITILTLSLTAYNIYLNNNYIEKRIEDKKKEFLHIQKETVKNKVKYINSNINIEHKKIEINIKEELREKINTAIVIAKDTINNNTRKSKKDLINILSKRLSILKYNKNRGYYYIVSKENIILSHPLKEILGKNIDEILDKNGNSIGKVLKNSLKDGNKIGFSKYYYRKIDDEKNYEKLTAVTYYEPLDIYIVTGEYLDFVRSQAQKELLYRHSLNDSLDKYIFILDMHNLNGGKEYSTMLLNNNRKELVGKKLSDHIKDSKGMLYRKKYLEVIRNDGEGYVEYWYKKPNSNEHKKKITYFYHNKNWNWVIASGFYLEDIEPEINKLNDEFDDQLDTILKNSLYFGVVFLSFIIIVSLFIFFRIQKRINEDRRKILLSQENLKNAQKVSKIGSWSYDIKTKELTWSDEVYKIIEVDKDNVKPSNKLYLSFIHKDDILKVKQLLDKTLKNKESQQIVYRIIINNKIRWIDNQSEYFSTGDDGIIVGTIQDITERYEKDKKIEEQSQMLFNQSKMAAMGEMLENIAHQWRQPLSVISTSASGIKIENEYNILNVEKLNHGLDDILTNTVYLSNTIEDFRKYFVKDKEIKLCNIKSTYLNTMKLLRTKFKNLNIDIIEDCKDLSCFTLENELVQSLINILNNAYDAIVKNNLDDKFIFVKIFKEYDNIVITIQDNAGGIDDRIIQKVFEPYFTTKHKSQGTGIGLYMTQEIITKHLKGYIKVSNEEYEYKGKKHKGACFKISISNLEM